MLYDLLSSNLSTPLINSSLCDSIYGIQVCICISIIHLGFHWMLDSIILEIEGKDVRESTT